MCALNWVGRKFPSVEKEEKNARVVENPRLPHFSWKYDPRHPDRPLFPFLHFFRTLRSKKDALRGGEQHSALPLLGPSSPPDVRARLLSNPRGHKR